MWDTKSLMLQASPRSSLQYTTLSDPVSFLIHETTSSDFLVSLAPMTTEHPCLAMSLAVYLPIPLFPPVITATLPYKLPLTPLYWPPLKYLLITQMQMIAVTIRARVCPQQPTQGIYHYILSVKYPDDIQCNIQQGMSNLLIGNRSFKHHMKPESERRKLSSRPPSSRNRQSNTASGAIRILKSSIIYEGSRQINPFRMYKGWVTLFEKCLTNKRINKGRILSTSQPVIKCNPLTASFSNSKLKATLQPTKTRGQSLKHCCNTEGAEPIKNRTKRIHTPYIKECRDQIKRRKTTCNQSSESASKDPYTSIIAKFIQSNSILSQQQKPNYRNGFRKKYAVNNIKSINTMSQNNEAVQCYLTEIQNLEHAQSNPQQLDEQQSEYLQQLTY